MLPLLLILPAAAVAALRQQLAPSRDARRRLQTPGDDGNLAFHEATFLASHNSAANLAVAEGFESLGTNQADSILDQLSTDGVRGLLLDILHNEAETEPLRLVHASDFITLDYGDLRRTLATRDECGPLPAGQSGGNIVVDDRTLDISAEEATAARTAMLDELRLIFSSLTVGGVALKDMTFKYDDDLWKDHSDWPTLAEIRESGQRLFVFSDHPDLIDSEFGFMYDREVMQENDWRSLDECVSRYMWGNEKVSLPSNDSWTRLFKMNQFCCGTGPDSVSFKDTVGQGLIGGGNNGWGNIYTRVQQCKESNGGFKPNFVALDWSAEAQQIRDFLNFGGRLGTGQTCTDDSHCATSSCNVQLGLCQCEECPADSVDVCLGCGSGEYCAAGDDQVLNTCQSSEGTAPQQLEPPTVKPSLALSHAPSESPSEEKIDLSDANFYFCGTDYFATTASCNDAVKCPGGNDDCPDGETCFAGIDCTPPPTLSPSDKPSSIPSVAPTGKNTAFCGTSFDQAAANCQSALPCPGPNGDSLCAIFGDGYSCFPNIDCAEAPPTTKPTPPPFNWTPPSGPTTSLPTARPTSAPPPTGSPSSRPTKAPFDFSNTFYCGANYTDAQTNCYRTNAPCPTGSPAACESGQVCFGGVTCTAPPSSSPTDSPTLKPSKAPSVAATPQQTTSPFDMSAFQNPGNGAATLASMFVQSFVVAVGVGGLLL
ncbi:LOW QUALITY PROTEIN: hypothetical protein ACHAXT_004305 [Thalassiosira profunda]